MDDVTPFWQAIGDALKYSNSNEEELQKLEIKTMGQFLKATTGKVLFIDSLERVWERTPSSCVQNFLKALTEHKNASNNS